MANQPTSLYNLAEIQRENGELEELKQTIELLTGLGRDRDELEQDLRVRTCYTCQDLMTEGYLLEEYGKTACSENCLDSIFPNTSQTLKEMTEEEFDESTIYWTDWE